VTHPKTIAYPSADSNSGRGNRYLEAFRQGHLQSRERSFTNKCYSYVYLLRNVYFGFSVVKLCNVPEN